MTGIVVVSFSFLLIGDVANTDCSFFFLSINSIASLAVAQNMRELYRLVLVDTPLAPYFSECITSEVKTLLSISVETVKYTLVCHGSFMFIV